MAAASVQSTCPASSFLPSTGARLCPAEAAAGPSVLPRMVEDEYRVAAPACAQDAGLATQMVLDDQPHRRIDRHRARLRRRECRATGEEIDTRGQHQSNTIARLDIAADQSGRDGASRLRQFCEVIVPNAVGRPAATPSVQAIGMLRYMPVEDLDASGLCGSRKGGKVAVRRAARAEPGRAPACSKRHLSGRRSCPSSRPPAGTAPGTRARSAESAPSRPRLPMPRSLSIRLDGEMSIAFARCG